MCGVLSACLTFSCFLTASCSYWYRGLAQVFPDGTRHMVLKKMLCELLLVIPLFEVPAFTIWTGVCGRKQTLHEAVEQVIVSFKIFWGPHSDMCLLCAVTKGLVECDPERLGCMGTVMRAHISICATAVAADSPIRHRRVVVLRHEHDVF